MRGELAVELGEQGYVVGEAKLRTRGGERRSLRRRCAIDDEARSRKRFTMLRANSVGKEMSTDVPEAWPDRPRR
jgi:hypothetical protein